MSRAVLIAAILASVLLAGCAGGRGPPIDGAGAASMPEGSGLLEGSVVNDAFVGVPGATVRVEGSTESKLTDLEGHFSFAGLPAGRHKVRVEAAGWVPAEVNALIESGATTRLTIFVEPQILEKPYSTLTQVRGKLNCVALRVITTTTEGMACDVYRKPLGFPQDWAATVTEVVWSKGATSTPYSRVSLLSKNASDAPLYGRQIAESPAKLVLRPATMHSHYQANAATPAKLESGPLYVEVTKSPVLLAGADVQTGLTVQQDFEIYHTTFYVETPSAVDEYSALPR